MELIFSLYQSTFPTQAIGSMFWFLLLFGACFTIYVILFAVAIEAKSRNAKLINNKVEEWIKNQDYRLVFISDTALDIKETLWWQRINWNYGTSPYSRDCRQFWYQTPSSQAQCKLVEIKKLFGVVLSVSILNQDYTPAG